MIKNSKIKVKNEQLLNLKTKIKMVKQTHYYNNKITNLVANQRHQPIKIIIKRPKK